MKAIKKLVVLGALATLCGNAAAANWVKVGATRDSGGTKTYYIDTDSVALFANNERTAWSKEVDPDGSYMVNYWGFKCGHPRQMQLIAAEEYYKNGALKKSHNFRDLFSESDWSLVVPESVGVGMAATVCSTNGKKGTSV